MNRGQVARVVVLVMAVVGLTATAAPAPFAPVGDAEAGTTGQLNVYEDHTPGNLYTASTVTARFYSRDGQVVVETTASDGTIEFSGIGLDDSKEYIVTVEPSDGNDGPARTLIVEDTDATYKTFVDATGTVTPSFVLQDNTGDFPVSSTDLRIEKTIDYSGGPEWETIYQAPFEADGENAVTIQENERFRIYIVNHQENRERYLGEYTAIPSDSVALKISEGDFSFDSDSPATYQWDAYLEPYINGTGGDDHRIKFHYEDATDQTSQVDLVIHERGDESNEILNQSYTSGPYGSLTVNKDLTNAQANTTWSVEWEATRNGSAVSGSRIVGPAATTFPLEMDPWWKGFISVAVILVSAGLFGGVRVELGAMVVSLEALGFWAMQWLPGEIGLMAILVALTLSVLFRIKSAQPAGV